MTLETENQNPNTVPNPTDDNKTASDSSDSNLSREPTDSSIETEGGDSQLFVVRNSKVQECMSDRENWYSQSQNYWKNVPSTVDGMLGGYGSLTHSDLCSSAQFIAKLFKGLNTELAIDCGAGIGRVTKGLLLNIFDKVEMIDTVQEHLDNARTYMGEEYFARVPAQHCCGLEDFHPAPNTYDLVWIQWVIIYLSDYDFVNLLTRFKESLKKDGYIVVKDNVTVSGCELDSKDSSVTRSDYQLKQIFKKAGLELVVNSYQKNFPRELYKVKYYALR